LNIAYLSTFYPFRGGIAQFNAALYNALKQQGHEVNAFTFTRQYPTMLFPGKTQMVQPGDPAEVIPSIRILDSMNPLNWVNTANTINKTHPDVMLMKYWMSYLAPSLGTVAGRMKKRGTKVVSIIDNAIPHEKKFFDKAFARYFFKRNSAFVAMSEEVKGDILSIRPDANVLLKPHPLYDHFGKRINREEAHQQLKLDPKKKTLLFFGFIREYKGLDILIDAFDALDESYQLVIAGEMYGSFDVYQKQIDANKNRERIHAHVRYIGDAEVPAFFSSADAVVLPYRTATQSGITAIAYHFESPLIISDAGGLGEIVHHEKTGLVVPDVNPENLAEAIRAYFSRYDQNKFMEEIRLLKSTLSWDAFTDSLLNFVASVS